MPDTKMTNQRQQNNVKSVVLCMLFAEEFNGWALNSSSRNHLLIGKFTSDDTAFHGHITDMSIWNAALNWDDVLWLDGQADTKIEEPAEGDLGNDLQADVKCSSQHESENLRLAAAQNPASQVEL